MATAQEIQQAYDRAKAKADAQKALQLKQAAENLALQTKQLGQLKGQAQQSATQQASQAYVSAQQGQRVLPSQLAQGGLAQSGYRSLAQEKMAQDLTKTRQSVSQGLGQTLQGYERNAEADKLNYNQNVASTQNTYNQQIADLNLDKQQANANGVITGTTPTNMSYQDTVLAGNTGRLTYEQYKEALNNFNIDATTKTALLQNYLKYQATRGVQ